MSRFRSLLAVAACSAALAACADSSTGPARESTDPLVAATNRNLPAPVVKTATQNDQVIRPSARGVCVLQPYSKQTTGTPRFLCGDGGGGGGGGGTTDDPTFSVSTSIPWSQSGGVTYVTLSASASYTYASTGDLLVSFRNVGGCLNTPLEYSSSSLHSEYAPFTLSAQRDAAYDGTVTHIHWAVHAVASAVSPSGVYREVPSDADACPPEW